MSLHRRIRQGAGLLLAASLLLALPAAGTARAGEPTDQLRAGIEGVLRVLRDPALKGEDAKAARRAKLRAAIGSRFDFTEMAKRSLATAWRKRTADEKKEFTTLFTGLMEANYVGKIERYTDESIHYKKEEVDGEYATVQTSVVTKDRQEVSIDYQMHKTADGWMVYDVIIGAVSLVKTYREQFHSIIQQSSYDALVKKLRAKQGEG